MKLSDQVRQAILTSGINRYRRSQQAEIHQSVLSRFVRGESQLAMGTLDRLGEVLGLELVSTDLHSRAENEEER